MKKNGELWQQSLTNSLDFLRSYLNIFSGNKVTWEERNPLLENLLQFRKHFYWAKIMLLNGYPICFLSDTLDPCPSGGLAIPMIRLYKVCSLIAFNTIFTIMKKSPSITLKSYWWKKITQIEIYNSFFIPKHNQFNFALSPTMFSPLCLYQTIFKLLSNFPCDFSPPPFSSSLSNQEITKKETQKPCL